MSFLTPIFFTALIAILIPLILHLINFKRPKKQAFSTLLFFQKIQKSNVRDLKFKKLILLLLRILAISLLVFALVRPVLSPGYSFLSPERGNVLYAVLVENSPAMQQVDEMGLTMDRGREAIEILINRADASDRFLLYNTHGELLYPETLNREQALRALENIEPENKGNFKTQRLTSLVNRAINTDRDGAVLFLVTRGGEMWTNTLDEFSEPTAFRRELLPVSVLKTAETQMANVAITNVNPLGSVISPGGSASIEVEVVNYSENRAVNHFLTLEVDGESVGQYQVDLEPNETRSYVFETIMPSRGNLSGLARLDGDMMLFDNVRYFAIDVPESRNILLVSGTNAQNERTTWLQAALEAAKRTKGQIDITRANWNTIDNFVFSDFDAILIDGEREIPEFSWDMLTRFVQNGGGLVLVPGSDSSPNRFNPFLSRLNAGQFRGFVGQQGRFEPVAAVDRIVRGHPVLDEIFEITDDEDVRLELPNLFYYWRYSLEGGTAGEIILQSNLNDPLLVQHRFGNGRVFVSSISFEPEWSSFAINPLFAPLFYRVALYAAAGETGGLNEFILGKEFDLTVQTDSDRAEIILNDLDVVPDFTRTREGVRLTSETHEWEPGWAFINMGEQTKTVAVNQNTTESRFATLTESELQSALEEVFMIDRFVSLNQTNQQVLASQIGASRTGREIWNWFIILGIVLIVAESVATRKIKGDLG